MDPLYAEETAGSAVSRGTSVKDRASQFEHQAQASSSRPRPLPVYIPRARSTSALRISRKTSGIPPSNVRRVPVPSTEPVERTAVYEPDEVSPRTRRTPPELKRGKGSAKRMIQQWESLPTTPAAEEIRPRGTTPMSARVMRRDYLDHKPLPVPQANPIPAVTPPHRYSPGRNPQSSPARTAYVPSPLQHLQTPTNTHNRIRSSTLTPSPSSHSLSPSPGEKRKKGGRSPLKEMLNVFGGGIQAMGRKAMGKGKEKAGTRAVDVFGVGSGEDPWGDGGNRLGTNGLPGGIVFSDRMGDQEMVGRASDDPNVRLRVATT